MTTPSTQRPSLPPTSSRKLRLQPHPLTSIPSHPLLSAPSSSPDTHPPLRPFILSLLQEAVSFADHFVPANFTPKGSPKSSSPSAAKVQLMSYEEKSAGESWFARRSFHDDRAAEGTASWKEFVEGVFDDHSIHEMEYTPDVFDAHKVLDWADEISAISNGQPSNTADGNSGDWEGFSRVAMEIYEMAHHIPPPLNNRVFPVLVLRALTPHPSPSTSFILVQIPLDLTAGAPNALYSTTRHRRESSTSASSASKAREKVTLGAYVSVERVKVVTPGAGAASTSSADAGTLGGDAGAKVGGEGSGQQVCWEMATASDAKGNLPMSLQKMGVPAATIKDVGFFIGWAGERRKGTKST